MCGVFGWITHPTSSASSLRVPQIDDVLAMRDTLAHRGPDSSGSWSDDRVFMGHQRLSIIDLSNSANQPYTDASERYVLSFNGEIYNYLELRDELAGQGHAFRTTSDTEVLLAALIQWGDGAFDRLDGMFAGAFYDRKTGRHLLFRDPLGQKPLYYFSYPGGLVYASELRALVGLDQFDWKLDRDAFARFLMKGYYALGDTPVDGIQKLLPGTIMEFSNGTASEKRYWHSTPGADRLDISDDEAVAHFETLFSTACDRAMRSDVPYGVFMSGGIDSSLILDFCHDLNPDIRSFTVSMSEADFDEGGKANDVAAQIGVRHHEAFNMNTDSVTEALDDVLSVADEPHGDPGFVNAYFLARSARPHLTVALAGDGGDELFAGYLPFKGLNAARYLGRTPGFALSILKCLTGAVPENDRYLGLRFKAQSYLRGFPAKNDAQFALWLSTMDPEDLARLCPDALFDREGAAGSALNPVVELLKPLDGSTPINRFLHYYQQVFLPEFVCMHTDRAAMQFGLEVRAPFLSPDLITFANGLPENMKQRGGNLKWLLREVAARRGLPRDVVRQKKQGFTFPLARWLKSALRTRMTDLLAPAEWEADGLIDFNVAETLLADHMEGRSNNYRILYNLMCFRAWRRAFPQVRPA